jgi:hypothetical protein
MRAFVQADPAKLARNTIWFLAALGGTVLIVLFVVLLASGRLPQALFVVAAVLPLLLRARSLLRRYQTATGPPPGQVSEIETAYLRMRLDHDSGTMSGTVRRGPLQGRRLDELAMPKLISLWRECRAEDERAASLLEAYLDRLTPNWREEAARNTGTTDHGASRAADAMTRDEAYAVLGLSPGAAESEIREAYHRLMMKLHPDQGGSNYLAAKLNRARDILLAD